jgi:hypothetical protein
MKCVEDKILEKNKEAITMLADDVKSVLLNLHHAKVTYYCVSHYQDQKYNSRQLSLKFANGIELELTLKGAEAV